MRSRAPLVAVVGLLGLALLIGLVVLAVQRFMPGTRANVVLGGDRPELLLRLRGAEDGEHVSVLGRDLVVQRGVARLALGDDTLRVGPNDLVVTRDGAEESVRVELERWVYRDDAALASDPPALGFVVRTVPGRSVRVDGQALALDAAGQGRFALPVPADGTPADHVFELRFAGGSAPEVLRVHLRAPAAAFALRQPPTEFVTERASIELDLGVDPGANVTLDGVVLANDAGRVRGTLALPRVGEFRFVIDVVQPGSVRRRQTLAIRRASDLAMASLAYAVDRTVTYASMAEQAAAERGKRVEVVGRVFNLRVEGGRSYLQLLADPCGVSTGCPVWVEYPAVTTARVGDTVHVRGVFVGPQSYRDAATGAALTSPHVDAAFVLAEAP